MKPKVPDSRDQKLDSHFSAPLNAHPLTKPKQVLISYLFLGRFQSKSNHEKSPKIEW